MFYGSSRLVALCQSGAIRLCRRRIPGAGRSAARLRSSTQYVRAASPSKRHASAIPYRSRSFGRGSATSSATGYQGYAPLVCRSIVMVRSRVDRGAALCIGAPSPITGFRNSANKKDGADRAYGRRPENEALRVCFRHSSGAGGASGPARQEPCRRWPGWPAPGRGYGSCRGRTCQDRQLHWTCSPIAPQSNWY